MIIATLLLALAVSVDGLGVGLSCGLRKIKLSFSSLLVVSLVSAAVSFLSMIFGSLAVEIFNPDLAERLGAVVLLTLGLAIIFEVCFKNEKVGGIEKTLLKFRIPLLGLAVQILKEPFRADEDLSGAISGREALALGTALALDALGIGFGAAAAGFSLILVPLCIGCCQLAMVSFGLFLGRNWQLDNLGHRGAAIPGLILIALGLWRL